MHFLTSRGHWFNPSRAHHQNPKGNLGVLFFCGIFVNLGKSVWDAYRTSNALRPLPMAGGENGAIQRGQIIAPTSGNFSLPTGWKVCFHIGSLLFLCVR